MSSKDNQIELLQGTLDLIVLRALSTMGPLHAYAPVSYTHLTLPTKA